MARKWEWFVGWIDGFGEVALEIEEGALENVNVDPLPIRRLTILKLQTGPQSARVVLAKWFVTALDCSGEVSSLRRNSLAIYSKPTKTTREALVKEWTGIETARTLPKDGDGGPPRFPPRRV